MVVGLPTRWFLLLQPSLDPWLPALCALLEFVDGLELQLHPEVQLAYPVSGAGMVVVVGQVLLAVWLVVPVMEDADDPSNGCWSLLVNAGSFYGRR